MDVDLTTNKSAQDYKKSSSGTSPNNAPQSIDTDVASFPLKESPVENEPTPNQRIKSSQKMRYSAEVEIIKRKWGDLETMRTTLGLSQRKMAQLLMVDPSAWTRWTRYEHSVPPHIYRAMSWFLLLQEKDPSNSTPYDFLQTVARPSLPKNEIENISDAIRSRVLRESQESLQQSHSHLKRMLIINGVLVALIALSLLFFLKNS